MKLRFAGEDEIADLEANPGTYRAEPQRNEAILYKGTGAPAGHVELRNTTAPPPGAEIPPPPYSRPEATAGGERNFSDRGGFEEAVFRQIGGNPFAVDLQREVDRATAEDMPRLFQKVFGGQVIWADRNKLDKNQQAYWQNELKRYRAHVHDRVASRRAAQVDQYKMMMGEFDAEAKAHEAAQKKREAKEKEWMEQTGKQKASEEKSIQEATSRLRQIDQDERGILKRMTEILGAADPIKGDLGDAQATEYETIAQQLHGLRQERHGLRMKVSPKYRAEQEAITRDRQTADQQARTRAAEIPDEQPAAAKQSKPAPQDSGKPIAVRRSKTTGKLLAKYSDGTIKEIEEPE
jgi:hypothetical protein